MKDGKLIVPQIFNSEEFVFCRQGAWKELENWHYFIGCQLVINLVSIPKTGLPERC